MVQKPLRHMPQGLVDLHFQRVADAPRVVRAPGEQRPDAERVVVERGLPEEGVEVEEVFDVGRSYEIYQVYLVEAVELVGRILVVEPPKPTVRQDAPLRPGVLDVEGDLVRRVFVREGVSSAPFSETSSGLSQYLASATAKARPFKSSSVRVLPLFAATELVFLYRT
jgi:hypothetical protein